MPLKGWCVRIDVMTVVSTMSICRVIEKEPEQLEFQRQRRGEGGGGVLCRDLGAWTSPGLFIKTIMSEPNRQLAQLETRLHTPAKKTPPAPASRTPYLYKIQLMRPKLVA